MTQSIEVKRCGLMAKSVKLCAEALTRNAQGEFVTGVKGVKMTLLKGTSAVESAETDESGVIEFRARTTASRMGDYTVRADLTPASAAMYQFCDQPNQDFERGGMFKTTGKAYVHKITFHLVSKGWIGFGVLDSTGAVVTGITVKITRPDGTSSTHALARGNLRNDGSFRLESIPPGKYKISLLDLDRDLWGTTRLPKAGAALVFGGSPGLVAIPSGGHVVAPGDCTWSLSLRYGVTVELIRSSNRELMQKYKNPDTLLAGETLRIPRPRLKEEECQTGSSHYFVIKNVPRNMTVRLVIRGEAPPEGSAGTVEIAGVGSTPVATDKTGTISFSVPPTATDARIQMPTLGIRDYTLKLGHLLPVESAAGVKQRLINLGYYVEPSPGETDEKTRARQRKELVNAVHTFQRGHGLKLEDPKPDVSVGSVTTGALVKEGGA